MLENSVAPGRPLRDVILIGGSQGGIVAVKTLLAGLPAGFRAAIAITIHRSATFVSVLGEVLAAHSKLPVIEPRDGQLFEPGLVYLAPQDRHLLLRGGAVRLDRGPKHHFVRPAIDLMFASGADEYGPRVIGVLLTGNLSDGVAGLVSISERGGLSLVQDPAEAEAPSMPRNAVVYDDVDAMFKVDAAAKVLAKLVSGVSLDEAVTVSGARRLSSERSHAKAAKERALHDTNGVTNGEEGHRFAEFGLRRRC
jgi:two-component system chemotaxis response regulator CheB